MNRCNKTVSTDDNSTSRSELISKVLTVIDTLDNASKNDPTNLFEATLSDIGKMADSSDDSNKASSLNRKGLSQHEAIYKWNSLEI